jgi:hypothetical protein
MSKNNIIFVGLSYKLWSFLSSPFVTVTVPIFFACLLYLLDHILHFATLFQSLGAFNV